jgi:hypothetical protein
MDEQIAELYRVLEIKETDYPPLEQVYDSRTPFKKPSATIDVPITIGNNTNLFSNPVKTDENNNILSNK